MVSAARRRGRPSRLYERRSALEGYPAESSPLGPIAATPAEQKADLYVDLGLQLEYHRRTMWSSALSAGGLLRVSEGRLAVQRHAVRLTKMVDLAA